MHTHTAYKLTWMSMLCSLKLILRRCLLHTICSNSRWTKVPEDTLLFLTCYCVGVYVWLSTCWHACMCFALLPVTTLEELVHTMCYIIYRCCSYNNTAIQGLRISPLQLPHSYFNINASTGWTYFSAIGLNEHVRVGNKISTGKKNLSTSKESVVYKWKVFKRKKCPSCVLYSSFWSHTISIFKA